MTTKLKDRSELVTNMINTLESLKHDKEKVAYIKQHLAEYKVLPGRVTRIINKSENELPDVDENLLYLLSKVVFELEKDVKIDPEFYYTPREQKEIRTNYEGEVREKIEFPYTFKNVSKVAEDNYIFPSDLQTVKELYENKLLEYNFETQREARQKTDKKTGDIIQVAKIVENSVNNIKSLIEKNQFDISMLTFNARLGSSDEFEELIYDEDNRTLTVTKGTLLDVLDGFHRVNGIVRALRDNPSINTPIIFNVVNYDKKRAQEKFVQINTTNPISNSHKKKMAEARQSDFVARLLQSTSELNGKVSGSDLIARTSNLLVTFGVLSDAIDEFYDIEDKPQAMEIAEYLKKFIDNLFFSFPDIFLRDVAKVREDSLANSNVMFYGYILLSKRMLDAGIDIDKTKDILSKIDFSRSNKLWIKNNVVDGDNLRVVNRAKKGIVKIFEEIELK
jgi:hypothetical protein